MKYFLKRLTKQCKNNHIDLLLLCDDATSKEHYVWIKISVDYVMMLQNIMRRNTSVSIVLMILIVKEILKRHEEDCKKFNGSQAVEMPEPGDVVKFMNYDRTIYTPFVIYADFEAIVVPIPQDKDSSVDPIPPDNPDNDDESEGLSLNDDPLIMKTTKLAEHKACSYGYKVVCTYDDELTKHLNHT